MKRWTNPQIRKRAALVVMEQSRTWDLDISATCARLNINRRLLYTWNRQESAPSAFHLAKLAAHGLDVMFILTGKRTKEKAAADGQDPQRQG